MRSLDLMRLPWVGSEGRSAEACGDWGVSGGAAFLLEALSAPIVGLMLYPFGAVSALPDGRRDSSPRARLDCG
jgi:hypothetical protein